MFCHNMTKHKQIPACHIMCVDKDYFISVIFLHMEHKNGVNWMYLNRTPMVNSIDMRL